MEFEEKYWGKRKRLEYLETDPQKFLRKDISAGVIWKKSCRQECLYQYLKLSFWVNLTRGLALQQSSAAVAVLLMLVFSLSFAKLSLQGRDLESQFFFLKSSVSRSLSWQLEIKTYARSSQASPWKSTANSEVTVSWHQPTYHSPDAERSEIISSITSVNQNSALTKEGWDMSAKHCPLCP